MTSPCLNDLLQPLFEANGWKLESNFFNKTIWSKNGRCMCVDDHVAILGSHTEAAYYSNPKLRDLAVRRGWMCKAEILYPSDPSFLLWFDTWLKDPNDKA